MYTQSIRAVTKGIILAFLDRVSFIHVFRLCLESLEWEYSSPLASQCASNAFGVTSCDRISLPCCHLVMSVGKLRLLPILIYTLVLERRDCGRCLLRHLGYSYKYRAAQHSTNLVKVDSVVLDCS